MGKRYCLINWLFVLLIACFVVIITSLSAKAFCYESSEIKDGQSCFFSGSGLYLTGTQGMCIADGYVIYTRWEDNSSPTVYVVVDLKTGKEAGHYAFATSHSNSLTYNPDTGEVIAAYGGRIYFIDFKDGILSYDGRSVTINHNCPKIAYDCERKVYYLGTTDYVYETDDFSCLRKKFKYESLGINQGMGFDGEYLYVPWLREGEDQIAVYDLNGNQIRTITVNDTYREIEEVDFYDGKMVMNVNSSGSLDGLYEVEEIHDFGEPVIMKEASCAKKGQRKRICRLCGFEKTEVINPTGEHRPGDWILVKEAGCGIHGKKVRKCSICGKITEEKETEALAHMYSEWTVTREPDVLITGERQRICIRCGEVDKQVTGKIKAALKLEISSNRMTAIMKDGDSITEIEDETERKNSLVGVNENTIKALRYGNTRISVRTKGGAMAEFSLIVTRFPTLRKMISEYFVKAGEKEIILKKGEILEIEGRMD